MSILEWLDTANEYSDLIKTGVAAASTYASYQDQKKKNRMQQQAYDDYMKQVAEAGKEARAAIDINYTPMTVSGVPTTKADVTDFTAVAAKGGLMSIPNRQRKRYARGPEEVDVMEMDEEVITPESFKMETGVDVTGEQVQYNTGNPRQDAWGIWNSGGIDQEIYEFDFEIFFDSGDWMDMLKGQAPAPAQNLQMASAPNPDAERAMAAQTLFGKPLEMLNQMELEQLEESIRSQIATGGIAGLRHGGRPGYNIGKLVEKEFMTDEEASMGNPGNAELYEEEIYEMKIKPIEDKLHYIQSLSPGAQEALKDEVEALMLELENIRNPIRHKTGGVAGLRKGYRLGDEVIADRETILETPNKEIVTNDMEEIKGQTAGGGARGWKAQMIAEDLSYERYGKEFYDLTHQQQYEIYTIALDMVDEGGMKTGGRVKRDNGGIMNLGGMEKDYRFSGGFVPIGAYEKKDDVPARLSKNEFVMTADAVRAAGGGSINKGAQRMYDTMKHLEAQPTAKRMTA